MEIQTFQEQAILETQTMQNHLHIDRPALQVLLPPELQIIPVTLTVDHPIQLQEADLNHLTVTAILHPALTAVVIHLHREVVHPTPLDHPLHQVEQPEVHRAAEAEDNIVNSTEL